MEYFVLIILFGVALIWAIHEREARLIARKGYSYYITYSRRWKKKRKACYKRFGYRCALCNSPRRLEAHHRTYKNLYNEKPGDLTCLCRDCHANAPKSDGLY